MAVARALTKEVPFGHVRLSVRQLFFQSAHSLGVINYKPIVPGHVMVIARRAVAVRMQQGGRTAGYAVPTRERRLHGKNPKEQRNGRSRVADSANLSMRKYFYFHVAGLGLLLPASRGTS